MNFGGHLLTGWLLGQTGRFDRAEQRLITALAVAPDVDGLSILLPGTFEEWHRTIGHNIFFGVAVPFLAWLFLVRRKRYSVLLVSYLAILSHYLLDLFVTGWWAMFPLWPFSDWSILMSLYIPENTMKYPIQITLFVVLVVLTCLVYRKKKTSPLNLVSDRFEEFVLTFATYPFRYRCVGCSSVAFYKNPETGEPECGKCHWGRKT